MLLIVGMAGLWSINRISFLPSSPIPEAFSRPMFMGILSGDGYGTAFSLHWRLSESFGFFWVYVPESCYKLYLIEPSGRRAFSGLPIVSIVVPFFG